MKNLSKFVIVSMILGILFLTAQCTKEKSSPPPETSPQHPIVGQWEWKYSVGFWTPGDTATPASSGVDKTLYFMNNDSVDVQRYIASTNTTETNRFMYEFKYRYIVTGDSAQPMDSTYMLYIWNTAYHFELYNDTLTKDNRYTDGSFEMYVRKSAP